MAAARASGALPAFRCHLSFLPGLCISPVEFLSQEAALTAINFVHIGRLPLLLLVLPLAYVSMRLLLARYRALADLGLPATPPVPRWAVVALFAAVTLFVLSLARPYSGFRDDRIFRPGRDVFFVVDISPSMTASDAHPSRIEAARRKLLDAARITEQGESLDRLGIILFSGRPFLFCPPTSDYAMFRSYISAIDPSLTTSLGTNINSALRLAVDLALRTAPGAHLILLSDGDDPGLAQDETEKILKEKPVALDAIGLGTAEGDAVRIPENIPARELEPGYSRLNSLFLRRIASAASGRYETATLDDSDIRFLMSAPSAPVSSNEIIVRTYSDLGPLLCLVAVLLGSLYLWRLRPALFLVAAGFLVFFQSAGAQSQDNREEPGLREGYIAYQSGDFDTAASIFGRYSVLSPDKKIQQALAASLFRKKRFREALRVYSRLLSERLSGRERFEVLYNLGNTRFALEEYSEAMTAYGEALAIRKDDEKAKYNMELASMYLDARTQNSPPEHAGSENERESQGDTNSGGTKSDGGEDGQGNSVRESQSATSEIRLIPSFPDENDSGGRTSSWIDALPETPLLPEKDKQGSAKAPEHWW